MDRSTPATLTLVALILSFSWAPLMAGELSAVLNGKSFHLGADREWNENNYGLGLEYEFASQSHWKSRLMANGFRDSNDEMSYMAGGGLHRTLYETERLAGFYIDAGINAFLMTRKDVNDNRPFAGMLPSLSIGNDRVGINITYLPKIAVEKIYSTRVMDDSMSGIVFLQLKINVSRD